jgi:hypothetical protein
MRHNQNGRHMRNNGRRGGGGGGHGGGGHHHNSGGGGGGGGGQQHRRNPRVQTFDSNGPDVRIRGTAFQINEKYMTLARDAASAGDRVLAESYFQHAEHYLRLINEMNEEFARHNPNFQPQQPQSFDGNGAQPSVDDNQQPPTADLDQSFLVGPRHTPAPQQAQPSEGEQPGFTRNRRETEAV